MMISESLWCDGSTGPALPIVRDPLQWLKACGCQPMSGFTQIFITCLPLKNVGLIEFEQYPWQHFLKNLWS